MHKNKQNGVFLLLRFTKDAQKKQIFPSTTILYPDNILNQNKNPCQDVFIKSTSSP